MENTVIKCSVWRAKSRRGRKRSVVIRNKVLELRPVEEPWQGSSQPRYKTAPWRGGHRMLLGAGCWYSQFNRFSLLWAASSPYWISPEMVKKNILNLHTIALANTTKDDDKSAGGSEFWILVSLLFKWCVSLGVPLNYSLFSTINK